MKDSKMKVTDTVKAILRDVVQYVCHNLDIQPEVAIRFPYERKYTKVYDGYNLSGENNSCMDVVFITFKTGRIVRNNDDVLGVACTDGDVVVRLCSIFEAMNVTAHELKHISQYTSYPVRDEKEIRKMEEELTLYDDFFENDAFEYGDYIELLMRKRLRDKIEVVELAEHMDKIGSYMGRYNMSCLERYVTLRTGNDVLLPSEASMFEILDSLFEEYEYNDTDGRMPISTRGLELSKMHILYVVRKWLEEHEREQEREQKQRENEDED